MTPQVRAAASCCTGQAGAGLRELRVGENPTPDHKVARAHGGTNGIGNLQMLCERCNFAKSLVGQQILASALDR